MATVSSSAVLTTRTPPGVIRTTASNHPGSQLVPAPLSNRGRRARTAYGHGCRLSHAHGGSNGPRPRLARCLTATRHRASPEAARGLAQRAVETAVFDRTKNRAERDVAAVWRNTAGRWRCPSRGSFVRGCRDHADRRGRARTTSGARFFRPVGHGSRSETSCRRRAGGHRRASYV